MELELGLKITKPVDNVTLTDLRIAKDRAGPLFCSRETETAFVLTAHLKGFRKDKIMIDISEDGSQISISGEKLVQEMVMVKWKMYKKEVEIKGFKKVFWIPDGVILNKIKAKFNEEDYVLSIFMPKTKKGIQGVEIQEVKQEMVQGESSTIPEPEPEPEQPETLVEEETIVEEKSSETHDVECIKKYEEVTPLIDPTEERQETEHETTSSLPETDELHTVTASPDSEEPTKFEPEQELHQPEQQPPERSNQDAENKDCSTEIAEETKEPDKPPTSEELLKSEPGQEVQQSEQPHEHPNPDIQNEDCSKDITEEETREPDKELREHEDIITNTAQDRPPEVEEPMKHKQDGQTEDQEIQRAQTEIVEEKEDIHHAQLPEEAEEQNNEEEEEERRDSETIVNETGKGTPSRRFRLCAPCIFAGSAFLGFFIVLVIQLIKNHRKPQKQ